MAELTQQQVSKASVPKLKVLAALAGINQWEVMDKLIDQAYKALESK